MSKNKTSKQQLAVHSNVLKTAIGTVFGTAALVGIHHRYRKQQQADARLQDYLTGMRYQLRSLTVSPDSTLNRLQYTYQQAISSYQNYPQDSLVTSNRSSEHYDIAERYTTVMLARPVCWVSGVSSMPKPTSSPLTKTSSSEESISTESNSEPCCGVVGIDADRQIVWQTTMPERVHDIVVQPISVESNADKQRDVVVMGRRPSEGFWVLDTATGQVKYAIKAAADRHFYGHACYSLDGKLLYVTENDTITLDGKIGIYDVNDSYQKIAEFDSYGIGPHELIMHPDSETLIIANGGIKTEQASREELNLDSMRPSLVYLNRHNGELLEQIIPEHNQMSIRHLAIHDNGTVMIGIQFQGDKHINVPLVLTHLRGDSEFKPLIMPNNQWQRFHQYIASVAVDSENNLLCVTTPIGGCAAIYDLTTRKLIDAVKLPDCAGASILTNSYSANSENYVNNMNSGFIVSDGQGQLTTLFTKSMALEDSADDKASGQIIQDSQHHKMSFDNHLQAL
ncbi:MAG: DUF1513 domain-containing protein [Psychrobacter sp.]|nr:DUF1513 domain-containing protein [Psychrobacter sp.]